LPNVGAEDITAAPPAEKPKGGGSAEAEDCDAAAPRTSVRGTCSILDRWRDTVTAVIARTGSRPQPQRRLGGRAAGVKAEGRGESKSRGGRRRDAGVRAERRGESKSRGRRTDGWQANGCGHGAAGLGAGRRSQNPGERSEREIRRQRRRADSVRAEGRGGRTSRRHHRGAAG